MQARDRHRRRTRLFHLEPVGMNTGFVESLTSYSARLAAAHNVTHASLFGREIPPLINRKHLREWLCLFGKLLSGIHLEWQQSELQIYY